jgi:hypothetical protein
MNSPQTYTFRSLDGYAGFRACQAYQIMTDIWQDGAVTVEMPHVPTTGRTKFTKQQRWEKG